MPTWKYEAVDDSGGDVAGEVDAPSVDKAMRLILSKRQFPTKIWCADPQPSTGENDKPVRVIQIYSR